MSNSFRIEESELRTWYQVLAPRLDVRGVAAIAKEIEAHMNKKGEDGTVVVSRHQLFTWAEALQGSSMRDGSGALPAVVADMRAILGGKVAGGGAKLATGLQAPADPTSNLFAPIPRVDVPQTLPPVQYSSAPVAPVNYGGGSSPRFVAGAELADIVRDMIRSPRSDLFVSTPWDTGMETLVGELAQAPQGIRILIVSRRPAQETPSYHQAMDQLGRRKAVTAFSPMIQTRMIIQDEARALVGAASIPGTVSREGAVLLTERAAMAAAREHFLRVHAEASGGRA
jgi:hypothetical protein